MRIESLMMSLRRRLRLAVFALCFGFASMFVASVGAVDGHANGRRAQKLDAHLRQLVERNDDSPERVIVQVERDALESVRSLLKSRGDKLIRYHRGIAAFTVQSTRLLDLADHPGIKSISIDATLDASQTQAPFVTDQVVRDSVSVSGTWTGAGVRVALIDSGLEPSADFAGRIAGFYDFTRGGVATAPYDDYGHGTHVAGLIGSSGALSGGAYAGIAPDVQFVVLKALDATGGGYTSDVINAIEFATANRAALAIDVINLSLGHAPFESAATDPLVQAVEAAVRGGIVVVASAGNYGRNATTGEIGYGGIASPGNAPSALTVGSFMTQDTVRRSDDRMNGFSSRGPSYYDGFAKPDIVAPGYRLIANAAKQGTLYRSYPTLRVWGTTGDDYLTLSGTSMAAGVTTGVVAQVIQANRSTNPTRGLPPNAIKAVLQHTAGLLRDDAGAEYDALTQGAGALNGAGAIRFAKGIMNASPIGAAWLDMALSPDAGSSAIGGETVVWGNT